MNDNELRLSGIFKIENHHIIPKHLCKWNSAILKPVIDSNFNLIRIPWFLHFFLHVLRYMEFRNQDDFKSINRMFIVAENTIGKMDKKSSNRNQFIFDLFQAMKTWQKSRSTEEKLNQDYNSRIRLQAQQNPEIQNLYQQDMIWKNKLYLDLEDLIISAGRVQLHTDTVLILRKHIEKFFNKNGNIKKPKSWLTLSDRNASNYVSRHLRYRFLSADINRNATAFWGFYIDFKSSKN